jgi:hypothetical protein
VGRLDLSEGAFGRTLILLGDGLHPDMARERGLEAFKERSPAWIFLSIYPSP